MSNYSIQYKEYYDRLKKKHNTMNLEQHYNQYDGIPIYRGSSIYTKNKKESFIGNVIRMQLLGMMMLFLFAFAGEYSSNNDVRKYYTMFKSEIEQQGTYTNLELIFRNLKVDSIENKFLESINYIKEKIVNDDFIY